MDLGLPAPLPLVLDGGRPALVVTPATTDFQIAQCQPLVAEAGATDEGDRALVPRLDARLHPVKAQVVERVAENELQAFAHVSLPGMGLERVVAEVGAAERAVHDLAEPEVADDRTVVVPASHELLAVSTSVEHVLAEGLRGGRRIGPGTMESARRTDLLEEFCLVRQVDPSEVHTAPAPAPDRHPRECRALTAILGLSWPAQ